MWCGGGAFRPFCDGPSRVARRKALAIGSGGSALKSGICGRGQHIEEGPGKAIGEAQTVRIHGVVAAAPLDDTGHETGLLEGLKMLGHGRLGKGRGLDHIAAAAGGMVGKLAQDREPCRMGERPEDGGKPLVPILEPA